MTSRQYAYQLRKRAEGKCPHCGGKRMKGYMFCEKQVKYNRDRSRELKKENT